MDAVAIPWRLATVVAIRDETPTVKTIAFDVPDWPGHLAGQHVDMRLTAEDGYVAQRSYSIASAGGPGPRVELTSPVFCIRSCWSGTASN
jgi:ferredoxin-NADP reductase